MGNGSGNASAIGVIILVILALVWAANYDSYAKNTASLPEAKEIVFKHGVNFTFLGTYDSSNRCCCGLGPYNFAGNDGWYGYLEKNASDDGLISWEYFKRDGGRITQTKTDEYRFPTYYQPLNCSMEKMDLRMKSFLDTSAGNALAVLSIVFGTCAALLIFSRN